MIRTFALWVILGFTLGLCTTAALACEDPVTIPEEESINDHCPGQSVPSCTIINPAVIEDQYDDDWYSFEVNAGTLITAGTDDPGGAPDTETIIELWHSNCSTMFAQDYHSGPRYFSLIYQFGAPYTGTYNLRVRGVYDPHPQPYEAFIYCGGSPIGACCLPSGDCLLTDRVQCAWEDGLFYGAGTTCDSVECPGVPVNDLCSGAIVIPTPGFGVLSGNSYHAHDNYNPWSPSCIDIPARGNDVVYRFDLELGDIVDLTYTQLESDASVYIVTDCARVRTSCVAGADEASYREPETLHYVAGTPIPGACCYEDHHCEILLEEICADSGGYWLGVWTDCDPNDCFDLWGVCCPPDWSCIDESDPWECMESGGEFIRNALCYWQPCPHPPGACCFENGDCQFLSGQDCAGAQGLFLGEGTTCDPNPCTVALGACCDPDDICHIRTPDECAAVGGTYQGDYVSCEETSCGQPVGACCFAEGWCWILTETLCDEYYGDWFGDPNCDPNPCPNALKGRAPTETQIYYLILDTNVHDVGGPWTLGYSILRPADAAEGKPVESAAALIHAAPNPFSGSIRIGYALDHEGTIHLEVFDVGGRAVRCLVDGGKSRTGVVEWDGRNERGERVPAGVYFVRFETGETVHVRAFILIE